LFFEMNIGIVESPKAEIAIPLSEAVWHCIRPLHNLCELVLLSRLRTHQYVKHIELFARQDTPTPFE
jgi:hypothetical protein